MMDKEKARQILGVTEDASPAEIEKRFAILLKKHKLSQSTQDENAQGNEYSFDEITDAYNTLMGYEIPAEESPPSAAAPILNKLGLDEKKVKNFFYYYKYYIIAIIAVLIIIGSFIKTVVTKVDPDFHVAFIGDFKYVDEQILKDRIKEEIPEIKEPNIGIAYLSEEMLGQEQMAMEIKASLFFVTGETDVFVLDRENYEKYAVEGVFLSLDEIAPELGVDMEKNKDYVLTANDQTEPHLYGINVTDSRVLKKSGIFNDDEMIAAIYANSKRQETALKVLELLTK